MTEEEIALEWRQLRIEHIALANFYRKLATREREWLALLKKIPAMDSEEKKTSIAMIEDCEKALFQLGRALFDGQIMRMQRLVKITGEKT